MKFETSFALMALLGAASARPDAVSQMSRTKREVPRECTRRSKGQEHSHEKFVSGVKTALDLNNPQNIQDSVFALLGNEAAAEGAGDVKDLDCLQQIVADQAFTNAKKANDVAGMTNALMFRAIERNTAAVGQASVKCTQTAKNPEIAALQQHQDPASDGAAKINKQITLELARQLDSIGANPQLALQSGTFAPGEIGDPTAAGNTCDVDTDKVGCIFTQDLLVKDATPAEIKAAVASAAPSAAARRDLNPLNLGLKRTPTSSSRDSKRSDSATNVNTFTGSVGAAPVPVTSDAAAAKPFSVNGDTFLNEAAAVQRACSVQFNACADAANDGSAAGVEVSDCQDQETQCNAQASSSSKKTRRSLNARRGVTEENKRAALDTGSCGSPAIAFGAQDDRDGGDAFAPEDAESFAHGSANDIAIIADFICGQLGSSCGASDATVSACDDAATAAEAGGLEGQDAADAFNSALGV
ncbi:hypothetical protein GGR56DRAFT_663233 [Xylariaceae sp. FL0804]|nr:hypothetical protein GGR56DRAFT_663233 [Xylariaceae sp. FL0804]